MSKPYAYVHREEFGKLSSIGKGGLGAEPDMEALISVNPEVIVATWDAKTADDVTATTEIPVITVLYEDLFDPKFEQSLHILGKPLPSRNAQPPLIKATGDMRDDLKTRGEKVPAEQRPSAYVGGVSFKGPHGITGYPRRLPTTSCDWSEQRRSSGREQSCHRGHRGPGELEPGRCLPHRK
ncbi:hypothetical protein [Corynebacterium belfantii]|uniref:Periplasmic binding protein n=1 Tax=Corynebacterium belfantii TaxID=2014537 RepID=A0ABS0LAX7_9CORY|nr:hypothetical protein [Corynebacterium belfantii]MBG9346650.1 hypothetical protein [Corynebacterium belfantii]MBG9353685.1 hypothetical protein [Corynebacterium belfantii]